MARAFVSQGLGEGMKLGTPAGDLERQARRLERKGYRTQAGALMGEAALLRAENRGFSSSERNIEAKRDNLAAEQAIINEKKKLTFTGEPQDAPTPAPGTPAPGTPTTGAPGTPAPGAPTTGTPGSMMKEARASRLDASPTPGLDAQDLSQSGAPARESFAQQGAQASREASLAGTFGARAQARAEKSENLEQRQSLFAEMRKAGVKTALDGDFIDRAKELGVDERGFDAALDRLNPDTATKPPASAPPVGRALAQKNIAEKGIQGAAADYFARKKEEDMRRQNKGVLAGVNRLLSSQ